MYLGRLSAKPTAVPFTLCEIESEPSRSCSGIQSLVRFYDSIPDYRDIHYLNKEEFYSTLDTLRSTCRELKTKLIQKPCIFTNESRTGSALTSNCATTLRTGQKPKKLRKKRPDVIKHGNGMKPIEQHTQQMSSSTFGREQNKITKDSTTSEEFRSKLQDNEAEGHGVNTFSTQRYNTLQLSDITKRRDEENSNHLTSERSGEWLRKSLSCNDLHSMTTPKELFEIKGRSRTPGKFSVKGHISMHKDPSKLSNYFMQKALSSGHLSETSKNIVGSPSRGVVISSEYKNAEMRKKRKLGKTQGYRVPLKMFDLSGTKRERPRALSASPIHPVARLNLAATLRAEVAKTKVKELQNNCIFSGSIPQVDWEVRKTPAWKSLLLNESHKNILSLRLATRKAEQALQQHQYELNMELMRQRVKTAPLLLEGPTYWGPHVGKLMHNCQRDGMHHPCQIKQRRRVTKKTSRPHVMSLKTNIGCGETNKTCVAANGNRKNEKLAMLPKPFSKRNTESPFQNANHCSGIQQIKPCTQIQYCCTQSKPLSVCTDTDAHLRINQDNDEPLSSADRALL